MSQSESEASRYHHLPDLEADSEIHDIHIDQINAARYLAIRFEASKRFAEVISICSKERQIALLDMWNKAYDERADAIFSEMMGDQLLREKGLI